MFQESLARTGETRNFGETADKMDKANEQKGWKNDPTLKDLSRLRQIQVDRAERQKGLNVKRKK